MIELREIVMIHELKNQGLGISEIARRTGLDRKTVRKHLRRGLQSARYGPRQPRPRLLEPFEPYLRERIVAWPGWSGRRLWREIAGLGYACGYTAVTDFPREARPPARSAFERRFETPPGKQAQVDFAQFKVIFDEDPDRIRAVSLFSLVLSHSRWLWGRFRTIQNLQTVLRCPIAAFAAMGGAPVEILYDRMKTAVIGETPEGIVNHNPALVDLLRHYGAAPRACRPYRAKTRGKVERPFRYVRQDFFLACRFRDLDDLNRQFAQWRDNRANARKHATTQRIASAALAEEQPHLIPLPATPCDAPPAIERRVSHEGMVSVGGNLHSVPDTARKRTLEIRIHAGQLRILEDGTPIAVHPVMEGSNQRRLDPSHRSNRTTLRTAAGQTPTARRPSDFHAHVAQRLAAPGAET